MPGRCSDVACGESSGAAFQQVERRLPVVLAAAPIGQIAPSGATAIV